LLDRPGGRFLLGKIATHSVRRITGDDLEIMHLDGFWTRRAGPYFFPDSQSFDYAYDDFAGWKSKMGQYVSDATEYWLQHYRPAEGDVIVDVGAGRGEDTVAFSRGVGDTGRVIAIEAHPLSFSILKKFCELNQLTNVTPLHLALLDKPGTVRVRESESTWMENTVQCNGDLEGLEVRAGTLDDLCEQNGITKIDFLKMNIEGAERQALAGMVRVFPQIRQICVACHDFRADSGHGEQLRTRAFVEQFLVDHGFELASRRDDAREYVRDHVFGLRSSRGSS
jgi:FkbM family methyltransferase